MAIFSTLTVLGVILARKRISPLAILFGGILYLVYATVLVLK